MARRLIQAGREAGDTAVPELSGMLHNIHRWEREGGISERHKLHYCRALGIHPSQFGPGKPGNCQAPRQRQLALLRPGSPACTWCPSPAPSRSRRHPAWPPCLSCAGCRRLPWKARARFAGFRG